MFAHVSGLEHGELVHVIADAHIYDKHIPQIKELISRPEYEAPQLIINHHDSFYDYTPEDFKLENYQHGEQIKIEVAI
jgi:thymidylate synthase